MRRLLRPITARLMWRVDQRIAAAAAAPQASLDSVSEDVAALKAYLPVLLNTISSYNATAREAARSQASLSERIAQIEQRGEFIRQEILYELRYGRKKDQPGSASSSPRIVDAEKLARSGDAIRLNLGCGHIPVDGYINVDGRDLPGVDVVAEVDNLPFHPAEVAEIFSAHLLEHFPPEDLSRRLLPYWYSLIRPGGRFVAVVPDADMMISEYAAGRYSFDDLRTVTFGGQEYEGDFHFTMFSQDSLKSLLRETGFDRVETVVAGRRNGACYEMEIVAHKQETGESTD